MPIRNIHPDRSVAKLRSVCFVVTRACNLNCKYCYEYRGRESKHIELDTIKSILPNYLDAEDDYEGVLIEFFGGEPFLAFRTIRDIVEWVTTRSWKKPYRFHIGTNGTILTQEIKDWLGRYHKIMSVNFSIDGIREAHNIGRDSSYDMLINNMPFFLNYWPNEPAKMTICEDTIPFIADGVIDLEEKGITFTGNVVFEDIWGGVDKKQKLLRQYEEQLMKLVDYYTVHTGLFPVSPLLNRVPTFLAYPEASSTPRRFCGSGHEMSTFDIDGREYPCFRFLEWVTGRPHKENVRCFDNPIWEPDKCQNCSFLRMCPTCAGYNWEVNGDPHIRTTFHCDALKIEIQASCQLEINRMALISSNITNMSLAQKVACKEKIEAIYKIMERGL